MAFIVIRDISGKLQITIEKEKHPEMVADIDSLTIDSVVTFEGPIVASEYVKFENMVDNLMFFYYTN